LFGVVLTLAHKKLKVEEDPRIDEVNEMLPGANCGACGEPGCRAFAESVVDGKVAPGKCTVSSAEGILAIAAYLGVDAGAEEKRVARLHCAGGRAAVRDLALYRGMASCRAAALVNGGGRACAYGCLGLGDCERACSFGAITMNDDGLPPVDVDQCTACNDCVVVCPLQLFALHAVSDRVLVQCSSPLTGDAARASCAVACDGCGRCALDAPGGAIAIEGGLARVKQPGVAGAEATFRCPTGAIRDVPGNQFVPTAALSLQRRSA
jgi:Na+-translocating ferredoxin:NAD+ oxidoreductase RNF subunit RnfB